MVPYLALSSATRTMSALLRQKGLRTEVQCDLAVSLWMDDVMAHPSASKAQSTVRMR